VLTQNIKEKGKMAKGKLKRSNPFALVDGRNSGRFFTGQILNLSKGIWGKWGNASLDSNRSVFRNSSDLFNPCGYRV